MSETYLDTLSDVVGAGVDGLPYGKLTRAQRVHVRSLKSDRIVAAFVGDDEVNLDADDAVICLTFQGEAYVEALRLGGLLPEAVEAVEAVSKPKRKRQTTRKPKASAPSVEVHAKPRDVWVPGGSQDTRIVKTHQLDDYVIQIVASRFPELLNI